MMRSRAAAPIVGWVRRALKVLGVEVVGRLLFYSGVLYLVGTAHRYLGRRRLLVPMYHRVRPAGSAAADALVDIEVGIAADRLEQHLRVMSWFGAFLPLEEAYDHLHAPDRHPRTVIALTFDDGYRDNLIHGLPVLERHRSRATIFPVIRTTEGAGMLWWDELLDLLRRGSLNGNGLAPWVEGIPELALEPATADALRTRGDPSDLAQYLCGRLLPLPMGRRQEVLELLARRAGAGRSGERLQASYLSWDDLAGLLGRGFEVGGHTLDHPALNAEAPTVVEEQVIECRRAIESRLRVRPKTFAFPNGRFDDSVCAAVRRAGFRLGVTVQRGVNYRDTDPYRLRRIPLSEERAFHLALKLAFYGWVHRPRAEEAVAG